MRCFRSEKAPPVLPGGAHVVLGARRRVVSPTRSLFSYECVRPLPLVVGEGHNELAARCASARTLKRDNDTLAFASRTLDQRAAKPFLQRHQVPHFTVIDSPFRGSVVAMPRRRTNAPTWT